MAGKRKAQSQSTDVNKNTMKTKPKQRRVSLSAMDDAIDVVLSQCRHDGGGGDGDVSDRETVKYGDDDLRRPIKALRSTVCQQQDTITRLQNQATSSSSSSSSSLSPPPPPPISACPDVNLQLQQEVSLLKEAVRRHEQTIAGLERRVNDLLSAFGLQSTVAMPVAAMPGVQPGASAAVDTGGHSAAAASSSSSSSAPPSSLAGPAAASPTPRTIRETIVAAVYIDKAASDRRSSSFIVSGLPPTSSCTDQALVTDLCHRDLGVRPDVTAAKRLGQPSAHKVQPLLVHVKTADEARQIIARAKNLRRSTDAFIRQNTFINVNLTRAEAKAAYEVRCRRRRAAVSRDTNSASTSVGALTNSAPAAAAGISVPLNPHSADFVPHQQPTPNVPPAD